MVGILTKRKIVDRVKKGMIDNPADECLAPCSYELRVGSYGIPDTNEHVELKVDETIAIAPHSFVLLGTLEEVKLERDIVGLIYLRSTYARNGLMPWFQGIIDPGYEGGLTICIHNATNNLVPIKGGERMCHLIFHELSEKTDEYTGVYTKSKGATPSMYNKPIKIIGSEAASNIIGAGIGKGIGKVVSAAVLGA